MSELSSRYLTHKQAAISGCTLFEATVVVLTVEIAVIGFAALLGLFFGYFFLCVLGLFILSTSFIKYSLRWLGKQKEGKPHGVFTTQFRKKLSAMGLLHLPFLQANGRLHTRRRV